MATLTRGAGLLAAAICVAPTATADQSAAFADYLEGARRAGLPIGFVQQAAQNLTQLQFTDVDGAVARYISVAGILTMVQLDPSLEGAGGALAPFDELASNAHATIFHEMWHCYLDTVERAGASVFYAQFSDRAEVLYTAYPADKRLEIHDEAHAGLVEYFVSTFLIFSRSGRNKSPWERDTWRQAEILQDNWGLLFESGQHRGYYGSTQGEVYVEVSLEPEDITAAVDHVLEGLFVPDFQVSFSDDRLFPDNAPPTAACDDAAVAVGAIALLNASASNDPEGAPLEFRWEQVDGPPALGEGGAVTEISTDPTLEVTAWEPGTVTLLLTAADDVRLSRPPLAVRVEVTGSARDAGLAEAGLREAGAEDAEETTTDATEATEGGDLEAGTPEVRADAGSGDVSEEGVGEGAPLGCGCAMHTSISPIGILALVAVTWRRRRPRPLAVKPRRHRDATKSPLGRLERFDIGADSIAVV